MTPDQIALELVPDPWTSSTPAAIAAAAAVMLDHGVPEPVVIDTLGGVVGAMRAEYGE